MPTFLQPGGAQGLSLQGAGFVSIPAALRPCEVPAMRRDPRLSRHILPCPLCPACLPELSPAPEHLCFVPSSRSLPWSRGLANPDRLRLNIYQLIAAGLPQASARVWGRGDVHGVSSRELPPYLHLHAVGSASAALAAEVAFNQRHMRPINTGLLVCGA